jgi:hypothetical protein
MEALAGGGVLFGIVVGFVAGAAFQSFRFAVQNLRKTRESLPGLKKTVSVTRRKAAFVLLALVSYAVIAMAIAVNIR